MFQNGNTLAILELLENGDVEMVGLVPWGSNYTFLVHLCYQGSQSDAIYKPERGERPLWDFSQGSLSRRERAAFLVSEVLNWNLVPPTVLRDGPHGMGSVQYFVEHETELHYLTLEGDFGEQTARIALFDVLVNNADRKSGHVLVGDGGRLWAIDHGVCFHAEDKLRSVIWEFAGEPLPVSLQDNLRRFHRWLTSGDDEYRRELSSLLSASEIKALRLRSEKIIANQKFPHPGPGRHYPWPLI